MNFLKRANKTSAIIVVLILLCGMCLGGYLVWKSKTGQADFIQDIAQSISQANLKDDLDYDGLKNWEEEIYGTRPDNPDSDGDGYLDGEEVASGHDPTIPAPNDQLADGLPSDRPAPGNLTQMLIYLLGQQMKTQSVSHLAGIQNPDLLNIEIGKLADEHVKEALERSIVGFASELVPPFMKDEPFEVADTSDEAVVAEYDQKVSRILDKLTVSCETPKSTLITAAGEAILTRNFAQANCLADVFFNAYSELAQMTVPQDLLSIHQNEAYFIWTVYKVFELLPQSTNDPLKGALVMQALSQSVQDFRNFNNQLQELINNQP